MTGQDEAVPPRRYGVRIALFTALVVVCAVVGIAFVVHARKSNPRAGKPQEQSVHVDTTTLGKLMNEPHLLFENTDLGPDYGKVEVVPLADPTGARAVTPLSCDRVAATDAIGLCLATDQGILTTYKGMVFDRDFRILHTIALPGLPSRARMSPNGHWAAMTVFVSGDGYASNSFSTRTMFVDTATGKVIGNLEQFHVTDNGATVTSVNRNFWGVTFAADSDHFYATLGRGTEIQLIEGSVSSRSAHTVHGGVECPSLSPDQTRVVYKLRVGGALSAVKWRLHVLDLKTGQDHALAETRSVDDQAEWLDNNTILYSLPRALSGTPAKDTYEVPADGSGAPTVFVRGAWSPAVGRAG